MAYNFRPVRNPVIRRLLESIFDATSGHDHDGSNSKAIVGTPLDEVTLEESGGVAQVKAGSIGLTQLAAAVLAASAAGRAKVATGFFDAASVADKFATDSISAANLVQLIADDAFAASAAARALFATGFFDNTTVLDLFEANSFDNAALLQLIEDGAFVADADTQALFAAGFVTTAMLAAGILSADAAGRAKIADDFFTSAEFAAGAGGKFAASCLNEAALVNALATDGITNAVLLQAVVNGAFAADANTRALFADRFMTYDKIALRTVEAHAADDTLTVAESGSVHVGNKADGEVVLTLPPAVVGLEYFFKVGQAQETRITPDGTETIALPSTGVQGAAGAYITANAVGETVHLLCSVAGTWDVMGYTGTWTAAP